MTEFARRAAPRALALVLLLPAWAVGQGAGSSGAELLQMATGARAGAFAGAYTAMTGDPDALFYNPASIWGPDRSVGLSYQAYVEDVILGTAATTMRLGPVAVGAGLVFLDGGEIQEIEPDPDFGGERGRPTGRTVSALEYAARVGIAAPLPGGRATLGANVGLVESDLAGVRRSAAFLDLGGHYRASEALVLGAAVRNLGAQLASDEHGSASLPLQSRLGATYRHRTDAGYGGQLGADVVMGMAERIVGVALGAEGGLTPRDGAYAAVLRAGVNLGEADDHLGRLVFGGGLAFGGLALDYTLQSFTHLGVIHRIGFRWSR